ncbi:MAG: TIR domain-containing protein, partial [Flavobacterium sp.]
MKVNVFISWSGDYSKEVAKCLQTWLNHTLTSAKPYYSSSDILKGARWHNDISKQLEITNVGLLIITPENFNNSWIIFEAGALSRKIDQSRVCPILFDMSPSDLTGPLTQFQTALFNKEDMFKVVQMINLEAGEQIIQNEILKNIFDQWWPKFEKEIKEIPRIKLTNSPKRNIDDINIEILEKLRGFERLNNHCTNYINKEFLI